ncbi:MAG: hypothetical protein ACR2G6_01360 [Gemmatimonadaceae bacterium]
MLIRRFTTIIAAAVGVALFAQGASADPGNAKNSVTVPLTCDGKAVEFVVIGNGDITPGHVVGSTQTFLPQSFDLTFIFLANDGTVIETETFTPSKKNPREDPVTCILAWTRIIPEGSIVGFGTVTGFFTPR